MNSDFLSKLRSLVESDDKHQILLDDLIELGRLEILRARADVANCLKEWMTEDWILKNVFMEELD